MLSYLIHLSSLWSVLSSGTGDVLLSSPLLLWGTHRQLFSTRLSPYFHISNFCRSILPGHSSSPQNQNLHSSISTTPTTRLRWVLLSCVLPTFRSSTFVSQPHFCFLSGYGYSTPAFIALPQPITYPFSIFATESVCQQLALIFKSIFIANFLFFLVPLSQFEEESLCHKGICPYCSPCCTHRQSLSLGLASLSYLPTHRSSLLSSPKFPHRDLLIWCFSPPKSIQVSLFVSHFDFDGGGGQGKYLLLFWPPQTPILPNGDLSPSAGHGQFTPYHARAHFLTQYH